MNLPNRLTIFRICLIPLFIFLCEIPSATNLGLLFYPVPLNRLLAVLVFIIASITDWLDGYIARRYHLVTNFGKFADPIADKMLVAAAFISLVKFNLAPAWVVSLILLRELAVSGLRLILVEDGEVLAAKWPGKIKTTAQMLAIIFLLLDDWPFGDLDVNFGQVCLYIALILTLYSGFMYFYQNRRSFL